MKSENAKMEEFKEKVLRDIEALLQFSLWLTKNGRDASRLLREAMHEAYETWDQLSPDESSELWLHRILTKRFFNGFRRESRLVVAEAADNIDDNLAANNRLVPETALSVRQPTFLTGNSNEDVDYFKAIASLPPAFRTTMILSCLEGFSNREIADIAGVQTQTVESLLNRGRVYLREELFTHLIGTDSLDAADNRETATG
ncbi:MAG: sigma-70 family RNA polymerase sigma factor [Candidatus Zixiibacteriota bacterium]